jgi:hypothetical protein
MPRMRAACRTRHPGARRAALVLLILIAAWHGVGLASPSYLWTFENVAPGRIPDGFEVITATADGGWEVVQDGGNRALARSSHRPDGAPGLILGPAGRAGDLAVSVRVKGVGGDRAGGVVWRYTPDGDYYLARLNLSQQRLSLYKVVRGNRSRIAGLEDLELDAAAWHTIKVEQRDDVIRVWLNGVPALQTRDRAIQVSGRVGLWTPPSSSAWFDDLKAWPLEPHPPLEP